MPPSIELSRAPGLLVDDPRCVLSGVVRDDVGITDILIYRGEEKIYYEGGHEGLTAVPFTTEATLEPGQNLFVILAVDSTGMRSLETLLVWYDDTGTARLAAAELPLEGTQVPDSD